MTWRTYLYIPLGSLPAIFFSLRMLVQWIQSEKQGKSYVGPLFWKLSLCGNLLLFSHHVIQIQYHFALLQSINALISWRNIHLFNFSKSYEKKTMIFVVFLCFLFTTSLFLLQSYLVIGEIDWVRTPQKVWYASRKYHSTIWHTIGFIGSLLFSSRFWIQWWFAERNKRSELGKEFWYMSIIGSSLVLLYSMRIGDVIISIYNLFGLFPYIRNLLFLRKSAKNI